MSQRLERMQQLVDQLEAVEAKLAAGGATADLIEQALGSITVTRTLAEQLVEAEATITALQAFVSAILARTTHAIIVVDAHEVIQSWNDSAERIYGWSPTQAIGQRVSTLLVPERYRDRHRRGFERFMASHDARERGVLSTVLRVPVIRHTGEELEVELLIVPAEVRGHFQCFTFSRDSSVPIQQASPHIDELLARL